MSLTFKDVPNLVVTGVVGLTIWGTYCGRFTSGYNGRWRRRPGPLPHGEKGQAATATLIECIVQGLPNAQEGAHPRSGCEGASTLQGKGLTLRIARRS